MKRNVSSNIVSGKLILYVLFHISVVEEQEITENQSKVEEKILSDENGNGDKKRRSSQEDGEWIYKPRKPW